MPSLKNDQKLHILVKINYPGRIIGCILLSSIILSVFYEEGSPSCYIWSFMAFHVIVWPHVAYWRCRVSKNSRHTEYGNLLIDSFFYGLWVCFFSFRLIPSSAGFFAGSLGNIFSGGIPFFLQGLVFNALGMAAGLIIGRDVKFLPESSLFTSTVAISGMLLYGLLIGLQAFSQAKLLRKTRKKLDIALRQEEEANQKMTDSLNYAGFIQRSILPGIDRVKKYVPNSFFIWIPKDIVGGDIYFVSFHEEGYIISLMDCTGHGVAGAFMTMIAYSSMRRIILDEAIYRPDDILQQVNISIKALLEKERNDEASDYGLDAAVCFVNTQKGILSYSGARLPIYHRTGNALHMIKGDKMSIGFKDSPTEFRFTKHDIPIETGASFYLATDGYIDQLGGKKYRRFGTKRFKELLVALHQTTFEDQRKRLLDIFRDHKNGNEQQDDVTVIGFQPFPADDAE